MRWFIYLIPVLSMLSALALYRKNGRREILKFDVVQFWYAFVLVPVLFVWFKSFLFFTLRDELNLYRTAADFCRNLQQLAPQLTNCDAYNYNQGSTNLSLTGLFIADTVYSVVFLFVYAFVVIHSLTKSLENKRYKDPLYDVFKHSEALHLWISHVFIYVGVMVLISLLSLMNVWFPLQVSINKWQFYLMLTIAVGTGVITFGGMWLSIFKESFWRLMKLVIGLFFLVHAAVYFLFDPTFSKQHLMYWMILIFFTTMVVLSFFFEKSNKAVNFFERMAH